jgi:cytochrome o ubiquinol oxidase operon protein cyoD
MEKIGFQISLKSYCIGFFSSLILTLTSFFLVGKDVYSGNTLIYILMGLAAIQACVQLVCFLHIGEEEKPRFNLVTFLFMALVLVIIVFGSIWIMHHLSYNVMPHMNMHQEGV